MNFVLHFLQISNFNPNYLLNLKSISPEGSAYFKGEEVLKKLMFLRDIYEGAYWKKIEDGQNF